jgi:hypothetical protein
LECAPAHTHFSSYAYVSHLIYETRERERERKKEATASNQTQSVHTYMKKYFDLKFAVVIEASLYAHIISVCDGFACNFMSLKV